jgi:uncharacterized membrane protein
MGENHFAPLPDMFYGTNLLLAAFAFTILQRAIIAANGEDHTLADAIGHDVKGKLSKVFYASGVGLTLIAPWVGFVCYLIPALMWVVPDSRIARLFDTQHPRR